jgi:hypothetical protein
MNKKWAVKVGEVSWDEIKADLMDLPKEQLVEMINVGLKNYWTHNNYWNVLTEKNFGLDTSTRLDNEVWQYTARTQAYRIKKALQLGDGLQDLAVVLKLSSLQWVNSEFSWEFLEATDEKLVIKVHSCPMGKYRSQYNIPLYPCKIITPSIYKDMAQTINPKFEVRCLHAYPDQPVKNVMCIWEFVLKK